MNKKKKNNNNKRKTNNLIVMGNWFSSKTEEKIIVNNQVPKLETNLPIMNSTLNLSIEEVLKECAIVVAIVFLWEFIKIKINKRAEKLAQLNPTI